MTPFEYAMLAARQQQRTLPTTQMIAPQSAGIPAPSLTPEGRVPTYDPTRGGADAPGSAVPAIIAAGPAAGAPAPGQTGGQPPPDPGPTSMADARSTLAQGAADRAQSQGGLPFSLPSAFNPARAAILASQGQYGPAGFARGPMAGAGLSSAPGIGAQLAALGGASGFTPGAAPQSLSGLLSAAQSPAGQAFPSPATAGALGSRTAHASTPTMVRGSLYGSRPFDGPADPVAEAARAAQAAKK